MWDNKRFFSKEQKWGDYQEIKENGRIVEKFRQTEGLQQKWLAADTVSGSVYLTQRASQSQAREKRLEGHRTSPEDKSTAIASPGFHCWLWWETDSSNPMDHGWRRVSFSLFVSERTVILSNALKGSLLLNAQFPWQPWEQKAIISQRRSWSHRVTTTGA